jgi:hypothetical protein
MGYEELQQSVHKGGAIIWPRTQTSSELAWPSGFMAPVNMQRNSIFGSQSPLTTQLLIQTELYITVHTVTFQWIWCSIYIYKAHPRLLSAVFVSHSQSDASNPNELLNYCALIEKQWANTTNKKFVVLHTKWVNKLHYPFPRLTAIQPIPVPFQQHYLMTSTAKILYRRWRMNERMNVQGALAESCWSSGGMIQTGENEVLIKTPSPLPFRPPQTLQTDLGSNPSLRGEWPATNRLSHFTACQFPASGWSEQDAKAVAKRARTVRYTQPAVF